MIIFFLSRWNLCEIYPNIYIYSTKPVAVLKMWYTWVQSHVLCIPTYRISSIASCKADFKKKKKN